MALLDLGPAALHLLAGHGAHGLPGQLHAADDGLKALVGKGWLLPVQLNDPGNPKDACRHSRGPSSQVSARPENSPDCAGLEGGLPHPLWVPPLGGKEGIREATSPCYREGNKAQIAGAGALGNGASQGQIWGSIPGSPVPVWSRLKTETDHISLITEKSPLAFTVLGLPVQATGCPVDCLYPTISLQEVL